MGWICHSSRTDREPGKRIERSRVRSTAPGTFCFSQFISNTKNKKVCHTFCHILNPVGDGVIIWNTKRMSRLLMACNCLGCESRQAMNRGPLCGGGLEPLHGVCRQRLFWFFRAGFLLQSAPPQAMIELYGFSKRPPRAGQDRPRAAERMVSAWNSCDRKRDLSLIWTA